MNGGMELYLHMPFCVRKMRLLRLPFISDGPGDPEPVHEAAQGRY